MYEHIYLRVIHRYAHINLRIIKRHAHNYVRVVPKYYTHTCMYTSMMYMMYVYIQGYKVFQGHTYVLCAYMHVCKYDVCYVCIDTGICDIPESYQVTFAHRLIYVCMFVCMHMYICLYVCMCE